MRRKFLLSLAHIFCCVFTQIETQIKPKWTTKTKANLRFLIEMLLVCDTSLFIYARVEIFEAIKYEIVNF